MKVLAIETVGRAGSVAALQDDRLLAELPLDASRRSAQTLAPAIGQLLDQVAWTPADIQLVAVASGPGSFTGLRIGVTTAKAFAYAVGCHVLGVPTMAAIAARVPAEIARVHVVLDAERGELFAGQFERAPEGDPSQRRPTEIVDAGAWLEQLAPGDIVTGPGLEPIASRLPSGAIALDPSLWSPTASAVGAVGFRLFAAGSRTTAFDLVPEYFRKTAAEEKAARAKNS